MRSGLHVRRQSLNGSAACVVRQELCTGSLSRICSVLYVTYGAFTWEGVPTFSARGALGLPTEPGAYALSAVRTPAAGCRVYSSSTESQPSRIWLIYSTLVLYRLPALCAYLLVDQPLSGRLAPSYPQHRGWLPALYIRTRPRAGGPGFAACSARGSTTPSSSPVAEGS